MLETIKKSLVSGFIFSLSVLSIFGVVFAVNSGDSLTSNMWNTLVSRVDNLEANNNIKAYASFNGKGGVTIYDSYGISNIVRNSAGFYTITRSTPFVNDFYIVQGACNLLGTGGAKFGLEGNNIDGHSYEGLTNTSVAIGCRNSSNNNSDSDLIHIIAYGDQ